ncbi:C-X-C motif chemokine 2-like [Scyliorhinus canicula]|uniref:C-X-C motif chemokine 2-like n=1 Tax=Scyliorhinus canicula TaxID=7830 RepID=UPI0018F60236|nr:C-X-C motif chemokine 2-like [Scyliorhinus canicula]
MNFRLQLAAPITTFFLLQHFLVSEAAIPLRCQCFEFVDKVPPKMIKNFQIFPKSTHCSRTEIILTVRQGEEVCLQPEAKQGKKLQDCWESIQHDPSKISRCIKRKTTKVKKPRKKRGRKGRGAV